MWRKGIRGSSAGGGTQGGEASGRVYTHDLVSGERASMVRSINLQIGKDNLSACDSKGNQLGGAGVRY
jgi:hypothetical protein